MPRVAKRSPQTVEQGSPLPRWIPPQLTLLSEMAPSGAQWLHEVKLDGFRMAARIEGGRARLLTNRSTGPAVVTTDMVTGSGAMRALSPA